MGTYRRRRAACPQGPAYCTYGVRVPASAVLYVPRTVPWHPRRLPPAARRRERRLQAHARAHGRARRPSSAGQPAGRPRLQLLGRPALCTKRLAATRAGRLSAQLRRDTHGATMVHAPCFECWLHGSCTFQTHVSVIVVGSRGQLKSSVDISPLLQRAPSAYPPAWALSCAQRSPLCAVACLQSACRL